MIVYHKDVVDGEAGNHIDAFIGIAAVEESVLSLGTGKFPDCFAGQAIVSGNCIGIKYLQSCVFYILQLFIIRTVHIRLMHTAPERTKADVPYGCQCLVGRSNFCFHFQGIPCLKISKAAQQEWFFSSLNCYLYITKSPEPIRFKAGNDLLTDQEQIAITLKVTVHSIGPIRFTVLLLIAFTVKK